MLRYRNTPGVRAAVTASPLVLDLGRPRLAGLAGASGMTAPALAAYAQRLQTPGLAELACLVDGVSLARTPGLRMVAPDEVWPPSAAV